MITLARTTSEEASRLRTSPPSAPASPLAVAGPCFLLPAQTHRLSSTRYRATPAVSLPPPPPPPAEVPPVVPLLTCSIFTGQPSVPLPLPPPNRQHSISSQTLLYTRDLVTNRQQQRRRRQHRRRITPLQPQPHPQSTKNRFSPQTHHNLQTHPTTLLHSTTPTPPTAFTCSPTQTAAVAVPTFPLQTRPVRPVPTEWHRIRSMTSCPVDRPSRISQRPTEARL